MLKKEGGLLVRGKKERTFQTKNSIRDDPEMEPYQCGEKGMVDGVVW